MNSPFTRIIRFALGLLLVVFGSNKFFHFIPFGMPQGAAGDFLKSLGSTGYILPIVGVIEVMVGIHLLIKRWVAFSLLVLFPISINILFFHLFLDLPGIGVAAIVFALNVTLIYKYWRQYKPLFYY